MKKKMYIPIPQPEVYYGVEVKENTKLDFENEYVCQTLRNLTLYTVQDVKTDEFETHIETKLHLKEGDLLLLEEEHKGYFKPSEVKFGSIQEAKKELRFIEGQMKKVKE